MKKGLNVLSKQVETWNEIIGPHRKKGNWLFVLIALSAIAETLSIGSVLPLLNSIVQEDPTASQARLMSWSSDLSADARLILVSILVVFLFFMRSALTLARDYYAAFFTNTLRHMWSTRIFENFLFGSLAEIRKEKQGHVINSMINEPIYAAKGVNAVIDSIVALVVLVAISIFLLWLNFWVTVISTILVILGISLLWKILSRYSQSVGKLRVNYNQEINHLIAESASGIRQIKVFSSESRVWKELNEQVQKLMSMMTRFALVNNSPRAAGEFLVICLVISALCVGRFVFDKDLSSLLPEAAVFAIALMKLFSMGSLLLSKRMEVATYWPSVRLVHQRSSLSPEEKADEGDKYVQFTDEIRLSNIHFSFAKRAPVLSNINCKLAKGQIIGLVGRSGAGKSTLCDILTKLVEPTSGEIYIDEKRLSEMSRSAWRQKLGYVSQEPFIFHTSVKENIKIGKLHATDQEIQEAAKCAQADSFVSTLPAQYETLLGVGGVGLSGGQKQRIALAQAFLRRPDILILDEATSGLDSKTEAYVFKALREKFSNALIILVTHRLSSLQHADSILFMKNGNISETGSFDFLYQQKGDFRELIDSSNIDR